MKRSHIATVLAVVALATTIGLLAGGCKNLEDPSKGPEDPSKGPEDPSKKVAVTGVTLNKTATTLTVGGTEILTATVTPSNAANKAVTWNSNNTAVTTVSNGTVTAVAVGTATITVTTQDGGETASCVVTVQAKENKSKYKPEGYTQYSYINGIKIKSEDYVYNTYTYTNETTYSGSVTQTSYDTSTNTITATYQHSWTRNANIYNTVMTGSTYDSNGIKSLDYSAEQTLTYFEDTVITTSVVGSSSTIPYTGNNAGQTSSQTYDNTYIVTNLGTTNNVTTYKVIPDMNDIPTSLNIIYLYMYNQDKSYTYEYYFNESLMSRTIYTNVFIDGIDKSFSFQNTETYNNDGMKTSYSTITSTVTTEGLKVISSTYDNTDTITSEIEYIFTRLP